MMESKVLEYKENITNTFLKTVSAFSNYDGGEIIFGINDDGVNVGLKNPREACLDIENKINDSIKPQPDYEIETGEGDTVVLKVHAGTRTPYLYRSRAYKRNETATIEVDHTELTRLILKGNNQDYEELPSRKQDLSFHVLEAALKEKTGIDSLDKNVLKTLNLFSETAGYNIAAEILADQNTRPGIDIGKFGDNISIIQKRKTYEHMSALSLYSFADEMFRDYYEYEVIEGAARQTIQQIPREAYREAVANALIHRLWDVKDNIRIFMFDERIEILSPGGLLPGISKEAYLAGDYSTLRNPIIGNVFYRLKLVEIFGTGIRRIRQSYKDSVTKPSFEIYDDSIKVILPVIKSQAFVRPEAGEVFSLLSKNEGSSMAQLSDKLPYGKTKIRRLLTELLGQKIIRKEGNGRSTKYYRL